jgi:MSHA biogenesis protein MshK
MNSHLITFKYLTRKTSRLLTGATYLLLINIAFADTLKDPTQPPTAFYNQSSSGQDGELLSGPVLQSIILGSNYHAAIINGQKIMLGQKYDGATLIKLNEREAVLRNPDRSLKILTMDYSIQKKIRPAKNQADFSKPRSQTK